MEGMIIKILFNFMIPIFALGLVVLVHELGHFIVARMCGIKVLVFSVGFGPTIVSWKRGETEYRIAWLLLGGYVKFVGDEMDKEDVQNIKGGYYAAKPILRTLTCLAGPMMNLIIGFLIYCVIYFIGRPVLLDEKTTTIGFIMKDSPAEYAGLKVGDKIKKIDGKNVSSWKEIINGIALSTAKNISLEIERENQNSEFMIQPVMDSSKGLRLIGISRMEEIVIDQVEEGMPAKRAGMISGDKIISLNGEKIFQWDSLMRMIEKNGKKEALVVVERNGKRVEIKIEPQWNPKLSRYLLGFIRKIEFIKEYPNPVKSMMEDIKNIFETLKALFARTVSPKGLAGPVGIVVLIGQFAQAGIAYFLGLMALISINLGIFNLLPIPVLDGGHIMFNTVESIRGKALSKKTMLLIQNVFVAILISFIVYVTYQDVLRMNKKYLSTEKIEDSQKNEYNE